MKQKIFIPLFLIASIVFSPCSGQKQLNVTYIANSGFLIESKGKQVIIDALFENGWGSYLTPADSTVSDIINQQGPFNNSNLMLITHHHGDHFNSEMLVAYLINNSENILIAPPKVINELFKHPDYKKIEKQIVQIDKNNQENNDTTINGIRVRSFFLQHDSRPQIENLGFLMEIENFRVFHSGDNTGAKIVEFEKLQLQNENIDLALLNFYGFWNTTAEREFTGEYINPKKMALMHIPPAEINIVKDSVNLISGFTDITVFESSMEKQSFIFK